MIGFVARRLWQSLLVIFGVTLVTFLSMHMGGDPTYLYVNEHASDAEIAATRAALGFDKPLPVQYLRYANGLLHGDMGTSLTYRTPAVDVVLHHFPATLELALFALIVALIFAVPLGILAAMKRGTPLDGGIMLVAMFGQSIPSFWLGIMMILAVGLGLRWLPISGRVPVLDEIFAGNIAEGLANIPHAIPYLIMPGMTIAFFTLARTTRLVRASMLEVLSLDYVRTARSKGLSELRVVGYHAMRNAMLPVVTMLGLEMGFLLSGVVVVETIFSWPGVGRLVYNAINHRDIPLVQTAVILFAVTFLVLNLAVDLLYAQLDPRIRLNG
ncbi:ABC transporter permease [Granulicella cerasi]|uniref:ABC transporter permease n=1 Tax=Granulicella cerasi TaxID=741063 RepID=A0ABW1ZBE3_9BACT|nr:ABC transporter permease [Granulicella cerasi]